jgi:Bifunctional DNA primase/polymerase, N-terminal
MMSSTPVPSTVGEPTRIGPGVLLAALSDDLELRRAAEVYAALGYPVLPCFEPNRDGGCTCRAGSACDRSGKHPRIAGGVWQATTESAVVRRWWRRWPTASVALRTGMRFDVADIDGQPGLEALRALLPNADGPVGCGPLARTGGGGWHLLFAPTGHGSPKRVLPGVDWRGRGGYVLVAPSVHPSGGCYRWVRPLTLELPEAPVALRALLAPPPLPAPRPPGQGVATIGGGYGPAALAAECARVRTTPPGGQGRKGRNDALNRAAFKLGQLVHAGLLDEAVVLAELLDAAVAAGLEPVRSVRTIDKAMTAARARPPATPGRRVLLR